MEIDYSPYLFVGQDGEIWWSVETAAKLAAGYLPVTDEHSEQGLTLRPKNNRCRADERSILASLNNELPTVKSPYMREHDGERYVRAREFLPWLNAYGIASQSAFHIPSQLTLAMQKALAERPKTETSNFKSLAAALDGWFDKDLEELPAEKRRLVEDDFGPIPWDRINSEQRKSVAAQLDYQHDPANVAEMQRAFDRWCEMDGIESQIREWELVGAPTALDKATKEDRLSQLRRDLDKMQKVVASPNQPEPEGWRQKFLNSQTAGIRPGDPKPEFIPYPKAMHELRERLGATPEELAVWVWMTPNEGSLAAFLNANELDNPPRFFYDLPMGKEFDYVAPLMRCWFIADDVHRFQPSDRYITGQDLLKRWEKYPGIRVAAFVRAKIEESRLLDIHPIFGATQWMHPGDESFPPAATALFVKAHVEAIEMEDLGGALADSGKTVPPAAILQVNPPASTETPKERGKRLLNRHTALKASGVRNPTQQLAKEEGITTVRLGQILRAARAAEEKPKHFAFPAPTNKAKKP